MARLAGIMLATFALQGCARLTLAWSGLEASGRDAAPPVLDAYAEDPAVVDAQGWKDRRTPLLREALQREVYGRLPEKSRTEVIERRTLDAAAFNGAATLEEYEMRAFATFGGREQASDVFVMNVLKPANARSSSPVILMESFCPRWDTIPHPDVYRPDGASSCKEGRMTGLMQYVFGRYIATPPLEEVIARGYVFATIFPSEFVADDAEAGRATLNALSAGDTNDDSRWGAIAAWAWAYSRMLDVLESDTEVDMDSVAVYGHSRYGKSALFAAAFDDRIDAVIAHQSGTGGASLNRRKRGESVGQVTEEYPHWFAAAYGSFAGHEEEMSIDQHQLLALIAPRPLLLGNARRDVWSDPDGAFQAARGASPVWTLLGGRGLQQTRLDEFRPSADLAFWLRPGTHGVVEEDWPAFLAFLDAHLKNGASGQDADQR